MFQVHREPVDKPKDFLRTIVADDLAAGRNDGRVVTRFPPEPNGYLHIGHAKSIHLNFKVAEEFGGRCHLRFDDTNPTAEEIRYVDSIQEDVRWLGYDWGEHLYFASDYFERMSEVAEHLIGEGKAYVDSSTEAEIRDFRGTVTEPGRPTPYRDRPSEESLGLFRRMRQGEFAEGAHVLRARIDLASPNMLLRDPLLYRIRHARHHRTGDRWPIYPLYDFAHALEDAIECVTHSFCTLEFENNRPLYDWVAEAWRRYAESRRTPACRPHQYEFARLNLAYTVMSKRKLGALVREGRVGGWDDPRMPTVAGLRRRGVTPAAIRAFCDRVGVTKTNNRIDIGTLEYETRDDLNRSVPRVLCVLRPLRVVITNYPGGRTETLEAPYYPHDVPKEGARDLPFSRVLYIDRDDFEEDPPEGYFRLAPGREVRLRYAYIIRCDAVVKDAAGDVVELRCSYDPETRGGTAPAGRKIQGTLHWVSAEHALPCEVRLYDRLFRESDPEAGGRDFRESLNPESLVTVPEARIEPSVRDNPPGSRYQFERTGYFCSDPVESSADRLIFNRTVTLRDTWGKKARRAEDAKANEARPARKKPSKPKAKPAGQVSASAPPPRSPALEARRKRYAEESGLSAEEAEILTRDDATADLFADTLEGEATPKGVANWIIHELPRAMAGADAETPRFTGESLRRLVALVESDAISSSAGREVLAEMTKNGGEPEEIVERKGLRQVSDPAALTPVADEVIAEHPDRVRAYRGGRTGLLGFFVGQVMRRTGGRANPELVKELLAERLGG